MIEMIVTDAEAMAIRDVGRSLERRTKTAHFSTRRLRFGVRFGIPYITPKLGGS